MPGLRTRKGIWLGVLAALLVAALALSMAPSRDLPGVESTVTAVVHSDHKTPRREQQAGIVEGWERRFALIEDSEDVSEATEVDVWVPASSVMAHFSWDPSAPRRALLVGHDYIESIVPPSTPSDLGNDAYRTVLYVLGTGHALVALDTWSGEIAAKLALTDTVPPFDPVGRYMPDQAAIPNTLIAATVLRFSESKGWVDSAITSRARPPAEPDPGIGIGMNLHPPYFAIDRVIWEVIDPSMVETGGDGLREASSSCLPSGGNFTALQQSSIAYVTAAWFEPDCRVPGCEDFRGNSLGKGAKPLCCPIAVYRVARQAWIPSACPPAGGEPSTTGYAGVMAGPGGAMRQYYICESVDTVGTGAELPFFTRRWNNIQHRWELSYPCALSDNRTYAMPANQSEPWSCSTYDGPGTSVKEDSYLSFYSTGTRLEGRGPDPTTRHGFEPHTDAQGPSGGPVSLKFAVGGPELSFTTNVPMDAELDVESGVNDASWEYRYPETLHNYDDFPPHMPVLRDQEWLCKNGSIAHWADNAMYVDHDQQGAQSNSWTNGILITTPSRNLQVVAWQWARVSGLAFPAWIPRRVVEQADMGFCEEPDEFAFDINWRYPDRSQQCPTPHP